MLINKYLANNGFIFPKDTCIKKLEYLGDLGCKNIVVCLKSCNNPYTLKTTFFIWDKKWWYAYGIKYLPCNITDIKYILRYIEEMCKEKLHTLPELRLLLHGLEYTRTINK